MVDKRVLAVIGVLIILAVAVLLIGLISPSLGGGGNSFSALFDRLEKNETSEALILELSEDEFEENQGITVKDKIISMRTHHDDTYFTFLYTGQKWINETGGTDFYVLDDQWPNINVDQSTFEIRVDGKYTASFDVGDKITLQTKVVEKDDKLVFEDDWEVLLN